MFRVSGTKTVGPQRPVSPFSRHPVVAAPYPSAWRLANRHFAVGMKEGNGAMSETAGHILRQMAPSRFRVEHPLAVNAKDGSVLVFIPAGEFEMGDGQREDCPNHQVELSGYWIGVYAVTNAQYLEFVEATGHRVPVPDTAHSGDAVWKDRSFPPAKADHPVVFVSWEDSLAYAKWAGCELASEAQWEKACRGPLGLFYPWGKEWDASKCRNRGNQDDEQTSAVYGYPRGVSGYGTYNQSGNVFEWCADWREEKYYGKSPAKDPKGPEGDVFRVFRGGYWRTNEPAAFRGAERGGLLPWIRTDYIGLRLVRRAKSMSNCREFLELLPVYFSYDRLERRMYHADILEKLMQHAKVCESCANEYEEARSQKSGWFGMG